MEDFGNPFYLHNGDHLGLVLVSHHLIGSNYNTWSHLMLMALTTKNKTSFIDGSITQLAFDHLLFDVWTRCNNMTISWILNVIFREIADSLLYIDNASKIYINLHDHFHQSNGPQNFQSKKQLISFNQGSLDVNEYFARLKILWVY